MFSSAPTCIYSLDGALHTVVNSNNETHHVIVSPKMRILLSNVVALSPLLAVGNGPLILQAPVLGSYSSVESRSPPSP